MKENYQLRCNPAIVTLLGEVLLVKIDSSNYYFPVLCSVQGQTSLIANRKVIIGAFLSF